LKYDVLYRHSQDTLQMDRANKTVLSISTLFIGIRFAAIKSMFIFFVTSSWGPLTSNIPKGRAHGVLYKNSDNPSGCPPRVPNSLIESDQRPAGNRAKPTGFSQRLLIFYPAYYFPHSQAEAHVTPACSSRRLRCFQSQYMLVYVTSQKCHFAICVDPSRKHVV